MRKRAFTLIELLVVIAIIAILAAILFPVFAKARARAQLTTCISNNKQLGTAFLMYIDDTDGRLPRWADSAPPPAPFNAVNPNSTTWDVYIFNLVKTKRSFTCPTNTTSQAKQATESDPVRSYSFPQNVSGMQVSQFKAPSKTVLLFEKGQEKCGVGSDATGEFFGQTASGATDVTKTASTDPTQWKMFHGTGMSSGKVFLFADGHAAFYSPIPLQSSTTNPFGYLYPNSATGTASDGTAYNWPRGRAGLGYCGSADSFHAGGPTYPGANLPDS